MQEGTPRDIQLHSGLLHQRSIQRVMGEESK